MAVSENARYGIVGLGVMGRNLALNLHSQNIPVAAFSVSDSERQNLHAVAPHLAIEESLSSLVERLDQPRAIFLMVTAGPAVDQVVAELLPLLEAGDAIMDGGNSFYQDTERRIDQCKVHNVDFLGVGVSGGEEGARHGASVMVGGSQQSYAEHEPLFNGLACSVEGEACCGHMGAGGAGHFVKMVHNGIEYGVMQLLAETYDFMRRGLGLAQTEIHAWFAGLVGGALDSYLLDITVGILAKEDELSGGMLLDQVSDRAGQKGTGQWSSVAALEYGVPTPTIVAAVTERQISGLQAERERFSAAIGGIEIRPLANWEDDLAEVLRAGMLATFSQGLHLIQAASDRHGWGTDVLAAVRLWRGGCIIRAKLLNEILACGDRLRAGELLLLAPEIQAELSATLPGWRRIVSAAVSVGVPMPVSMSAISYVDSLRSSRLPTALIQAQRDCFGAHTFERIDRAGTFHVNWLASDDS